MSTTILLYYVVPIIGASIIVMAAILFGKTRRVSLPKQSVQENKKTSEESDTTVEALIHDNLTLTEYVGEIGQEDIKKIRDACGSLGRLWAEGNKSFYSLVRTREGNLVPMQFFLSRSMENPPARLFDAHQQQETHILYNMRADKTLMQKLGPILLFVFGIAFIIFMMVMQNKG